MNLPEQNLTKSDSDTHSSKFIEHYAHGKLLISGEYLVLDGASALAVPTKYGQKFSVHKTAVDGDNIYWKSYNYKQIPWLQLTIDRKNLTVKKEEESKESRILINLLDQCRNLNPEFLKSKEKILVESHLEFPNNWGLGSSSTLIYFLANWAEIDPFELLFNTMKGSGYDIACASGESPILYSLVEKKPKIESVAFKPSFKSNIHFVHLNKKQNSRMAIHAYEENKSGRLPIKEISDISRQMVDCQDQSLFEGLIDIHEGILSNCLKTETIKSKCFPDFNGSMKSLGAWGGDFIMVTRNDPVEMFSEYFVSKGYKTILSFEEMVL